MRELVAWLAISSDRRVEATSWFISGHAISVDTKITEDLGRSVPSLQLPIGDILMGPFQVRHGWPADLIARIKELCRTAPLFSIWEGVALDGWSSSGDFIHLSLTLAEPVVTRRLALATGPWAIAGAPPEVRSKRVAACHLEVPPTDNAPVVLFGDHDAFLLPLPNEKRWLFSFASPIWDVAPESSHCMSADDDQISEHILKKYVPRLAPYRRGGRVFCDAYSPDRAPQVVCASGQANVIFVGASSGSGYRLAPGMADRAVDLLEVV
jgi:glycine/D-amino acid oxidase-like deaminating enzyme